MAEDARPTGDVGADDLAIHRSISPRERVDAILDAKHLSRRQAAAALTAHVVESQGTCPHVVVASIDPEVAAVFDEPEKLTEQREHIGPFSDRQAAETWAVRHYADKPGVDWTTAQVRRPQWVEDDVRRLRGSIGPLED